MSSAISFPNVNRVEVIDDSGRVYSTYGVHAVVALTQDGDRTLKIFVKDGS